MMCLECEQETINSWERELSLYLYTPLRLVSMNWLEIISCGDARCAIKMSAFTAGDQAIGRMNTLPAQGRSTLYMDLAYVDRDEGQGLRVIGPCLCHRRKRAEDRLNYPPVCSGTTMRSLYR